MSTQKWKPRDDTKISLSRRSPTKVAVYNGVKAMLMSGLSVIPINADGTKSPAFELLRKWSEEEGRYASRWSQYKSRKPTIAELRAWYRESDADTAYGVAVLGGAVSGGLEIIDVDNWGVVEPWIDLVEKRAAGLIRKLVLVQTPRPGMHAYFRSTVGGGNVKLAYIPDPGDKSKRKAIIEVKGEAGYCLAPPSPASCHPTKRCYRFWGKRDFSMIPSITAQERDVLFDCARQLDCFPKPKRPPFTPRSERSGGELMRPGDAFNHLADWADILKPHGWSWQHRAHENSEGWSRPGKSRGTSATTNFGGSDLLYVFSTNADPFDGGTAYSKFHAYALLNHAGDFHAAAQDLAAKGYGRPRAQRKDSDPYARYSTYSVHSKIL